LVSAELAEVQKPAWPKTPDGTIDWEVVFEHPESGVIPLMMAANGSESLHKCAVVVIRQLFTRKNDEEQVIKFLAELERIIGAGGGETGYVETQSSVVSLLRRIKSGRIKRAAAYLEQKKNEKAGVKVKSAAVERREEGGSAGRAITGIFFGSTLRILVSGGVIATMMAAVVAISLMTGEPAPPVPDPLATEEPSSDGVVEDVEEVEEDDDNERPVIPEHVNKLTGMPESRIDEFHQYVIVLKPVVWQFNTSRTKTRSTHLLPVLGLRDDDDWADICRRLPSMMEAINISLSRNIPSDRKTTESDVYRTAEYARNLINERLGGDKLERLALMQKTDKSMISKGSGCRLIEQ
jgi:hypothetical protein